ncbi:MAG: hypothetical protein L0196_06105 [candidate division Zixibacteria bacterium]|nr:hypothetical protein [candidate division Zixibacteria bacterium]
MKRLLPATLALGLLPCLFCFNLASAQTPDPRDSVIVESKTVNPGVGSPATSVKVFITNKDSLGAFSLILTSKSQSGGAYMTLGWPRNFNGAVRPFTNSLNLYPGLYTPYYNGSPPDTFAVASFADPQDPATFEPPNAVRKLIWEIEFDTIRSELGTVWLDSVLVMHPDGINFIKTRFTAAIPSQRNYWLVPVNFSKGVITVTPPDQPPCNDLNGDGNFSTADIVEAVNCLFSGEGGCGAISTAADIVKLLKALFSSPGSGPVPLVPPVPC